MGFLLRGRAFGDDVLLSAYVCKGGGVLGYWREWLPERLVTHATAAAPLRQQQRCLAFRMQVFPPPANNRLGQRESRTHCLPPTPNGSTQTPIDSHILSPCFIYLVVFTNSPVLIWQQLNNEMEVFLKGAVFNFGVTIFSLIPVLMCRKNQKSY